MHLPIQITDLGIILGVAAFVTFLFQKIRQPVVLGYLLAGLIVGPYTPTGIYITDIENVKVWAELGVIFLMFSLGLEFTFHKLSQVGSTASVTAIFEVLLMVMLGFGTGQLLGWGKMDSLFLGGILSISSTTIIVKAFDELGVKKRRFAQLVFGVLIVEDLVAVLLLVALSTSFYQQTLVSPELAIAAVKLFVIVGSWFLIGFYLIPTFLRYAGKVLHNEGLTVLASALCLGFVILATHFEYSAALGAFMMGSLLAETSEVHRIENLIHPLRDLFAAVFFVSVGMLVDPSVISENAFPIFIITLVTIVGKSVSSAFGALVTGQPLKSSIQIGMSLAQIGEFSFIIAALGTSLKATSGFLYPIAIAVSVVTTFTTPYLIRFSAPFAEAFEKALPISLQNRLAGYVTWAEKRRWNSDGTGLFSRGSWRLISPYLFQLALMVWVGVWSASFFSAPISAALTTLAAIPLVFLFYRRLEKSYRTVPKEADSLFLLAPWNLVAVRLMVPQNSSVVAKRIVDLKVRTQFGVNIVAIQRGPELVAPPGASDLLLPMDELLILGTEEQVEQFRKTLEAPRSDVGSYAISDYTLKRLDLEPGSPLIGLTIRDSGVRESLNGLVVGLERGKFRTLNPGPETVLQVEDTLWLVSQMAPAVLQPAH